MMRKDMIIATLKSNLYIVPSNSSLYSLSVQVEFAKPLPVGEKLYILLFQHVRVLNKISAKINFQ